MKIKCDICKGERHYTALHVDSSNDSRGSNFVQNHDEESPSEETTMNPNCTEICGEFKGKSCARILPVRIFVAGKRHRLIERYAMFNDESNKTLGESERYDDLGIQSESVEYAMHSCSGKL